MDGEDALAFLEGETLTAVTFVWNYYQFLLGTETLSVYSDPVILDGKATIQRTDAGYRDALCGRIGKTVVRTSSNDTKVELIFDDGIRLVISLRPEDRVARELQESLVVTNPEGGLLVVGDSEPSS